MRIPKSILILAVAVVVILNHIQLTAETTSEQAEIVLAARRLLSEFLTKADREYLLNCGGWILPEDDYALFELGEPYPLYKIDQSKLSGIRSVIDYQNALIFRAWGIPVRYNGKPRTWMQLEKIDGEWIMAVFGGDSAPIEYVRRTWPIDEGYSHSVTSVCYQIEFISIHRNDVIDFYSFGGHNAYHLGLEKQENGQYPTLSFDSFVGMVPVFIELNENAFRIVD